jgi:hypothetical protein
MLIIVVVVAIIIFLFCLTKRKDEKFQHLAPQKQKPSVMKKIMSNVYMQNMPPSLEVENNYHGLVMKECGGNYNDFNCLQKAYIKAMKNGSTDRTDLICAHFTNEDDRYACMDAAYGTYLWMNRATNQAAVCGCGTGPWEGHQHVGIVRPDGSCMCPTEVNLNDRSPRDLNWHAQPFYNVAPEDR